ncbi:lipoprotein [Cedecea neteri]|uniref:Lipoprotein n=1 Tax=Cedecea neteri TaxID=158822 RepID=A0A291DY00_9ENTR|nr:YnfC family lipoprotein [Cedecea neteri]ATF92684.1 YnfC family lipoprotein [Cedecea neteri]SQC93676.1 lipoprotein [Cedecea neteri]
MKLKRAILLAVPLLFCSFSYAQAARNPVIANLATMFDFNAPAGNVREMYTVMKHPSGQINYENRLKVDRAGCVTSLDIRDSTQKMVLQLHREGNVLTGTQNGKPLSLKLDEKCLVKKRKDELGEVKYAYWPSGLLKDIFFMPGGQRIAHHEYDANGLPRQVDFYMSDKVASQTKVSYEDAEKRPFDYKLVTETMGVAFLTAESHCRYDEQLTPVACDMTLVTGLGNTQQTQHQHVTTDVSYY